MLFSSYGFVLAFLPVTYAAFLIGNRLAGARGAVAVLLAASLVFYAAWDVWFLVLLLASIGLNFLAALWIAADRMAPARLGLAVAANLALLGWFKYAGFLAANIEALLALRLDIPALLLPLGISFFTFEQIAYLIDIRRGAPPERDLPRYALFVAFFPRVVAGPILRFSELMPQIPTAGRLRAGLEDVAVGLTIFTIGLAKKTLLADGVAPYANEGFAAAGGPIDLFAAWGAVLAYTVQLYFDFSGYSDMAIGAARLFGLRFPQNFASPYRSTSIIAFWRGWHITLSRFLRDYLYFSLGGNRRGAVRRYANLMLTMVLGGLWHGANWTFVAWGALHGMYLLVNHAWRARQGASGHASALGRFGGWLLTMLAVMVAWVFFRAPDFGSALSMLAGMAGLHGAALPAGLTDAAPALGRVAATLGIGTIEGSGTRFVSTWGWALVLAAAAALLPNTQQIMARWQPVIEPTAPLAGHAARLAWRPGIPWAACAALLSLLGLLAIGRGGEFLYWQF